MRQINLFLIQNQLGLPKKNIDLSIPIFIFKVEDVCSQITLGPNTLKNEKIIIAFEVNKFVLIDFS